MKSKYSQLKEMLSANNNVTGLRKNSNAYTALQNIAKYGWSRTAHTTGNGRYITLYVYTLEVKEYLNKLNIAHEVGNDAPRGGKHGEFIKVTDRAFIKAVKAERWAEMEENAKPVCVARIFKNIDGWRNEYTSEYKRIKKAQDKRKDGERLMNQTIIGITEGKYWANYIAVNNCIYRLNKYEDKASLEFALSRANEQIKEYLTKHNKL